MNLDTQVIILAAGKGTRMKSELAKVLHKVCGVSLVEHALRAVSKLSTKRLILVVGHSATQVKSEVESHACSLKLDANFVIQKTQNGTGDAVRYALESVSSSPNCVLIIPGDVPLLQSATLEKLVSDFYLQNAAVTCLTFEPSNPDGYGRIVRNDKGEVIAIVEHRDCNQKQLQIREVNSSIYAVDINFLKEAISSLKPNNAQNELYLTDIVAFAASRNHKVSTLKVSNPQEVAGINTKEELSKIEVIRRSEINSKLMLSGVTMEDPLTTYIDEDVEIEPDCFIGANTRLKGKTKILSGTTIEGSSLINNSTIGQNSFIKLNCYIEESCLEQSCQIGPFAHLRPGTNLESSVKIGNFVETKKVKLSKGVKVNHLSYIGDATVGENTNVGAGTITCNYDGKNKNQITIGKNSFVGSNSCLVAPLTIGENAYIGAGSTVTEEVPDNSLALGRARQINKENWVNKRQK
jgi:bifunctional UDP-N-acetylglucosamine pyrophosphorylase/glucosamine-1-phosphate N-acetyltransferase